MKQIESKIVMKMTLRDTINSMVKEEDEKFLKKDIKKLKNEEGTNKIILEIRSLKEEGIYDKLLKAYKHKFKDKYLDPSDHLRIEEGIQAHFLNLAYLNLSHPKIHIPKITDLISLSNINSMDELIENLYFMNLGRKMTHDDMLNIAFSGLEEKLICALEDFDNISKTPNITAEFFKNLKEVKWKDKSIEKLFWNLSDVRTDLIYGNGLNIIHFRGLILAEDQFLQLLAGSSCVNNSRDKINKEDIITAYKTYIKLLKTDITQYKAEYTTKNNGFLFCKTCKGYYPLEENESPEDFTDVCQCGGKLEYYQTEDFERK